MYSVPPRLANLNEKSAKLGLRLLEIPLADMCVECDDGVTLPCQQGLLESRWSWFAAQVARGVAEQLVSDDGATPATQAVSLGRPQGVLRLAVPYSSEVIRLFLRCLALNYSLPPISPHGRPAEPSVLAALLVFASDQRDPRLAEICKFALYRYLDDLEGGELQDAAALPRVLEAATLSGLDALQVRTLRIMMVSSIFRSSNPRLSVIRY